MTSRGFIALMTVLITASLFLSLSLAASLSVLFARRSQSEEEEYRTARLNAYTCSRIAFDSMRVDPVRFESSTTVHVPLSGNDSCIIVSASSTEITAGAETLGISGNSSVHAWSDAVRDSTSTTYFSRTWREN